MVGIKFNDGDPITGLQFAPTSCEVINVNNAEEVYDLWDSSEDMMCNSEDHPVNFEIITLPAPHFQMYAFQYTGKTVMTISFHIIHLYLKDSSSTQSRKLSVHNDSNVILIFVMMRLKIHRAQQVVLNQLQQQQQQQHRQRQLQRLPLPKFLLM